VLLRRAAGSLHLWTTASTQELGVIRFESLKVSDVAWSQKQLATESLADQECRPPWSWPVEEIQDRRPISAQPVPWPYLGMCRLKAGGYERMKEFGSRWVSNVELFDVADSFRDNGRAVLPYTNQVPRGLLWSAGERSQCKCTKAGPRGVSFHKHLQAGT